MCDLGPGQLLGYEAICLPWWQYDGRQGVLSTGGKIMRPWTWSIAQWWSNMPA